MRTRCLTPFAPLLIAFTPWSAHAAEAACQPVLDAGVKRFEAPAYHQRMTTDGQTMEMIKAGGKLYGRSAGEGWALVANKLPPALRTPYGAPSDCAAQGSESVDGQATTVYAFKTLGVDGKPLQVKVWVGRSDGLPYRESQAGAQIETRYAGVKAPL